MADEITRKDAKLVQYLSEAHAKEKELEGALEAQIGMTTKMPYKKRLRAHLTETRRHARELERRVKKIAGSEAATRLSSAVGQVTGKAKSALKGPMQMARGTGEAEKMLKNAKTQYWNEHEEIATYTAIEALAESVKDRDTAKLARAIRREEERMAKFLEGQIPQLTRAVVREEVPAAERRTSGSRRRRSSSSRSSSSRKSSSARKSSSRGSGSRGGSSGSRSSSSGRSRSSGRSSRSRSRR